MRTLSVLFASLVFIGGGGVASAAAEVLAPETAASEVAKSSGIVLVNLYAHW